MIDEADRNGLSVKQVEAEEKFKDVLSKDSVNTNAGGITSEDGPVFVSAHTRSLPGEANTATSSTSAEHAPATEEVREGTVQSNEPQRG